MCPAATESSCSGAWAPQRETLCDERSCMMQRRSCEPQRRPDAVKTDKWTNYIPLSFAVAVAESLSRVRLLATPWTAACQACLSITNPNIALTLWFPFLQSFMKGRPQVSYVLLIPQCLLHVWHIVDAPWTLSKGDSPLSESLQVRDKWQGQDLELLLLQAAPKTRCHQSITAPLPVQSIYSQALDPLLQTPGRSLARSSPPLSNVPTFRIQGMNKSFHTWSEKAE